MMAKSNLCMLLAGLGLLVFTLTACVKDTNLDPPTVADQSFTEPFDTLASALARGWRIANVSVPKGSNIWQQDGSIVPWFAPYSGNGSNAGFIGADYTSTTLGVISNWVVSPPVVMQNGDKIIFYTRNLESPEQDPFTGQPTGDSTDFGNRLQVRINTTDDGANVGSGTNPGSFTSSLLDINPTYVYSSALSPVPTAYPSRWTRFEATVYGLEKPHRGRFAFRYFVEYGGVDQTGATAADGNGVAIDQVSYQSAGR